MKYKKTKRNKRRNKKKKNRNRLIKIKNKKENNSNFGNKANFYLVEEDYKSCYKEENKEIPERLENLSNKINDDTNEDSKEDSRKCELSINNCNSKSDAQEEKSSTNLFENDKDEDMQSSMNNSFIFDKSSIYKDNNYNEPTINNKDINFKIPKTNYIIESSSEINNSLNMISSSIGFPEKNIFINERIKINPKINCISNDKNKDSYDYNTDNNDNYNNNIMDIENLEVDNSNNNISLKFDKFNGYIFKENKEYFISKYPIKELHFKSIKEYIQAIPKKFYSSLIGENALFNDEADLMSKRGKIYTDIYQFLELKKRSIRDVPKDRMKEQDNMVEKIKTQIIDLIFEPFKGIYKDKIKIRTLDKKDINGKYISNAFNYILLLTPIKYILSNNDDNLKAISKIINDEDINNKENNKDLIEYLNNSLEHYLDYFLLIKEDDKKLFNGKNIAKYLIEEKQKLKNNKKQKFKDEEELKDYIASLLLLSINLKRRVYLASNDFKDIRNIA